MEKMVKRKINLMKKEKKVESRFNSNEKNKKISIHERWEQDAKTLTIECKDGIRRTLDEIVKLKEQGVKVL